VDQRSGDRERTTISARRSSGSTNRTEERTARPVGTGRDTREQRKTVMTAYRPESYAFRFKNDFVNVISRIPPRIGRRRITTDGRCGGMSFASLDFFHIRTPVPKVTADDFPRRTVPPDGHPLADYIHSRQMRSILRGQRGLRDGLRFIRWSGSPTSVLMSKTRAQMSEIRKSIDAGEPVVLGLIAAKNISISELGENHQVVCYGYRTDGLGGTEFLIYEPNEQFDPESEHDYEVVLSTNRRGQEWRDWIRTASANEDVRTGALPTDLPRRSRYPFQSRRPE
jgi:hypothetical protein